MLKVQALDTYVGVFSWIQTGIKYYGSALPASLKKSVLFQIVLGKATDLAAHRQSFANTK